MELEFPDQAFIFEYLCKYCGRLWTFLLQENIRFCYNARGSLEETLSHLVFSSEAKYIPDSLYKELSTEGDEIDRMLNGYIAYLKRSKQGANEPGSAYSVQEISEPYTTEFCRRRLISLLYSLFSSP